MPDDRFSAHPCFFFAAFSCRLLIFMFGFICFRHFPHHWRFGPCCCCGHRFACIGCRFACLYCRFACFGRCCPETTTFSPLLLHHQDFLYLFAPTLRQPLPLALPKLLFLTSDDSPGSPSFPEPPHPPVAHSSRVSPGKAPFSLPLGRRHRLLLLFFRSRPRRRLCDTDPAPPRAP